MVDIPNIGSISDLAMCRLIYSTSGDYCRQVDRDLRRAKPDRALNLFLASKILPVTLGSAPQPKDRSLAQQIEARHRRFQLILIKPSHYDDDGYVIRWWKAMIPSNSLAAIYGIARDCAERAVLGPDIGIDIVVIDETNTRIKTASLIEMLRQNDNFGMVALGQPV